LIDSPDFSQARIALKRSRSAADVALRFELLLDILGLLQVKESEDDGVWRKGNMGCLSAYSALTQTPPKNPLQQPLNSSLQLTSVAVRRHTGSSGSHPVGAVAGR
jgi:hypothetical protein